MTESESGYSGVSNDQAILDDINELSNEELQQKTHEALLVEELFTMILIVGAFRFSQVWAELYFEIICNIIFSFLLSDCRYEKLSRNTKSRLTLWDITFKNIHKFFKHESLNFEDY